MSAVKRIVYPRTDFPQDGWIFSSLPFPAGLYVPAVSQAHTTGAPRDRSRALDLGFRNLQFAIPAGNISFATIQQLADSFRLASRPSRVVPEEFSLPWLQLTPVYDPTTFPPILHLASSFRLPGHPLLDVRDDRWSVLPWSPIFYPELWPSLDQQLRSARSPERSLRHPGFDETPRDAWYPVFHAAQWPAIEQQLQSLLLRPTVARHPAYDVGFGQIIPEDLFPGYHAAQWAALDQALRSFRMRPPPPGVNRLVDYLQFISSAATLSGSRAFVRGNSMLLVTDGTSLFLVTEGSSQVPKPDEEATLL